MKSCPEFYTYAQDQCDQHSRFDSQLPATEQYFRFLILLRKRDLIVACHILILARKCTRRQKSVEILGQGP